MNFTFDNTQLNTLQGKSKLFSYINGALTKVYFRVAPNTFTITFKGKQGAMSTDIPVITTYKTSESQNPIYFSADYSKWCNLLQKFNFADSVNFTFSRRNMLNASQANTHDTINLSTIPYEADSVEAMFLENYITEKKSSLINDSFILSLSEELLEDFQLADSLFVAQGRANSIGLSENEVIYSDRSVVLRIHLLEELNHQLFSNLGEENYMFIHSYFLKLFPLLAKTSSDVYFSDDYDTLYWEDEDTRLLMTSESKELALPTEEQWEGIKPIDSSSVFTTTLGMITNSLNFFTGFYEETAWKPISFKIEANKQIQLYYRHPTTEITKTLPDAISDHDGEFMVSSETLIKILNKITNRFSEDEELLVNFDEDSLGVYCKVNDIYEFVISKLHQDNLE